MCIVDQGNAERYSLIKKICSVERAIPTQIMRSTTIRPKPGRDVNSLKSVGTKVAIQINAKLGGIPWLVDIPPEKMMVVGFDVYHDTKDKTKSYGALVATMDMNESSNFFSCVSPHKTGNEISNNFVVDMEKALMAFKEKHENTLPEKILIYRDGVGEGQINYVREIEIKNLLVMLDERYKGAPYGLTFIIVSKRIKTRLFEGYENPSPGTVVDDIITLPER